MGSIRVLTVVLRQFVFFVRLDVFFSRLLDAAADAPAIVRANLLAFHVLVEDQLVLDFLRQLVQLELAVVTQVGGREQRVKHDLKAVVEDLGYDPRQQGTADFQARVSVHLDQVEAEVFVNHEIVTEELDKRH